MILEELSNLIKETLDDLGYKSETMIKKSNRPDLCDYQYDGLFSLSKEYHKNPFTIGEELCDALQKKENFNHYLKTVEVVKPGFLNMVISDEFINEILKKRS